MEMETDATQAAGRPWEICEDTCLIVGLAVTTLFTLWLVVWFICARSTYKGPEFSVAIAAVSGLEPAPGRPVLDPEFNLTVRITVRGQLMRSCDKPHTTVQVSYHGFTLASASAPEVCRIRMYADDDRTAVTTVVARGTRVWLPGPALDSLAADLGRAAGAFDVALTIPPYMKRSHHDDGLVVSCLRRPIGDDGGNALCDVSGLHLT
jgi:hypothetical protein